LEIGLASTGVVGRRDGAGNCSFEALSAYAHFSLIATERRRREEKENLSRKKT